MVNNLIEFTIDNVTYYSEEGMTFGEWVNSEYNTGGYVINSYSYISHQDDTSESKWLFHDLGAYVGSSQSIISGEKYSMASCPP